MKGVEAVVEHVDWKPSFAEFGCLLEDSVDISLGVVFLTMMRRGSL